MLDYGHHLGRIDSFENVADKTCLNGANNISFSILQCQYHYLRQGPPPRQLMTLAWLTAKSCKSFLLFRAAFLRLSAMRQLGTLAKLRDDPDAW